MAEVDMPEKINSFREVCAVDEVKALQYLNHCDGNLEDAVQLFFSTGGSLQNTYEGQHNIENDRREQQSIRRPVIQQRNTSGSWWNTIMTLFSIPFRFAITTLYDIIGGLFQIFGSSRQALTDPKGDVERFIQGYNDSLTGDTRNKINFYQGSYDEVLRFARSNLRMLLVYVHHPYSKNSATFINNVLHTELIRNLIAEQELIVFGVATTSAQGRVVASNIRSDGEPLLGLITFRNSTPIVALRLSGVYDPETVALNLRLACEDYQTQLNLLRMQKAQREENQRIREEQEREYQESAAKDRARIQERRRLESEKAEAVEVERKKQQEVEDRKTLLEKRKAEIGAVPYTEPDGNEVIRIQIRFPSGARLDRKFSPNDNLEALFEAAFSHEQCPIYFSVFTNFPRKEVHCAPDWYHKIRSTQLRSEGIDVTDFISVRTFHDEGLDHSCVVMIQDCLA